jgi:hypothetical protein
LPERETTLNFIASRLTPDTVRKRLPIWGFVAGSVILFIFAGCGTLKNGRSWGEDAFYPVDFKKISHAAFNAFFDLQTLIPAAGALIFAVDDFDDEVSDWATDHNPIFGSDQNAKDASDVLRAEFFVTALATPSGNDARKWTYAKTKGLGVELAALGTTLGVTGLLKATTDRDRPDCSTPVQRIRYASNETNYCPQCQTGGKLLADRALSRLLKKDWPRTVEELEAIKRRD